MKTGSLNTIVTLIALLAFVPSCNARGQVSKDSQKRQFELVSKYKENTLFDVSTDGNLILLYGARTPTREAKSGGVTVWNHKRGDEDFDILRVVEWASGRELGSIHVHSVPGAARFTEGAKEICYQEENENKLWDYKSGRLSACRTVPTQAAYKGSDQKYDSPDGKFVAELSKETVREIILLTYVRGVVTILNRNTGERIGSVPHPTVREPYDWPLTGYIYSVAFTPDNQHLITSYEHDTYIWLIRPTG